MPRKTVGHKIVASCIATALSRVVIHHKNSTIISQVIKYVKKFAGAPYKLYTRQQGPTKDGPPFWIENKEPPPPERIYKKGLVCTGVANLARRFVGLEVPGHILNMPKDSFIGGTGAWFRYLTWTNRLEKIDVHKVYPIGTLLLQDYNSHDQGHVAMVISSSKKGLLHAKIIHAVSGVWDGKKYNSTVIEKCMAFPDYTRFTHCGLPENWLLKKLTCKSRLKYRWAYGKVINLGHRFKA